MQQLRSFGHIQGNGTIYQVWQDLHHEWWRLAKSFASRVSQEEAEADKVLDWGHFIVKVWPDNMDQLHSVLSQVFSQKWRELRDATKSSGENPSGRATSVAIKLGLAQTRTEPPWTLFLFLGEAASVANQAIFKRFNDWWAKAGEDKRRFLEELRSVTLQRHGRTSNSPPSVLKDDVLKAMKSNYGTHVYFCLLQDSSQV